MCFCVSWSYCLLSPRSQCLWSPLAQLCGLCWWALSILTFLVDCPGKSSTLVRHLDPQQPQQSCPWRFCVPSLHTPVCSWDFCIPQVSVWFCSPGCYKADLLASVCEILWLCLSLSSFVANVSAASNQLYSFQLEWPFFYLKTKNQRCILSSPLWLAEKK